MKGVLLIIVRLPLSPGGALERGISVGAEGNTMKLVPPIVVVMSPLACVVGAANVVGPTTKKGVLLIIVVGAPES
jgi:hypothetical protein